MTEPVVKARGLTKRFKAKTAVDQLDLTISPGVIYGFLGPNGCGKTTAMRMLTGLLTPTEGEVEVLGTKLPGNAEGLKREIGYMTQIFSHYKDMTVRENLAFAASMYGFSRKAGKARIDELLNEYDLTDQAGQMAGSMSGGQKQRLALAATVLHHPKLLFLDEPTSAVDPESRRNFWEKLFDLVDGGASIIVSTHFMDEAERCHKIAILDQGAKRVDGAPFDLMENLGLSVVEIEGDGLRQVKRRLMSMEEILSASQVGARLRVLVDKSINDPIGFIREGTALPAETLVSLTRPNLEDVFVQSTGVAP